MTKDKALKMALEALEYCWSDSYNTNGYKARELSNNAITAIKEALAQPEQERPAPCARHCEATAFQITIKNLEAQLAQPKQEPVGWFGYDQGTSIWFETNKGEDNSVPLYTTPPQQEPVRIMGFNCKCGRRMEVSAEQGVVPAPQRTWVGLTWEEIDECFKITPDQYLPAQIYRRIEAKLKEKNT